MSAASLGAYVLDCPDPAALAGFYGALLDWPDLSVEPGAEWATLRDPGGGPALGFQLDPEVRASTWPSRERHQMAHLDFQVADLAAQHERALALGARLLDDSHESFWVYADPAGHPFCLCR
ncbi:VOC family protein [Sciscionella marina]|uniref:VOC family protein n=1 Tax=Sciscionella marina TaxID=508770 RepID=UPI000361D49D|nr:VOC family protein [Sciscionella marina]